MSFKEYKCPKCGWVHAAISEAIAMEQAASPELYAQYFRCFRCGAPTDDFIPALPDDAPLGCTIQGVVVPGVFEDKGDFEPLTDEQYAVLSKAAPAQRGKTVSSLFDPTNDHLFTAEAAHKAFAHISASDKVKAEVARKFKQLDAWPENADEALALIERFVRLQHKHSSEYELELTFYCFPVFRKEIEAVLNAEDKLAAASALMSEKLNQWD